MQDLDFAEFEPVRASGSTAENHSPVLTIALADPARGTRRYTLLAPLTVNGEQLDEIALRHPTQGELDDYANGDIETRRLMLAQLTDVDPLVIKALIWPDSQALHQMLADILPDFLRD